MNCLLLSSLLPFLFPVHHSTALPMATSLLFLLPLIPHLIHSFAVDSIESCFIFFPNRYLEKSGSSFLSNLTDSKECQHRCLTSTLRHNQPCKSCLWKRDTQDCILSRYNRFDRYDRFLIAPNLEIDYFENICVGKEKVKEEERIRRQSEERTTVSPVKNVDPSPKRRSISGSPQIVYRLDDTLVVTTKRPLLIRPGPVTTHFYRDATITTRTTPITTVTSTTTPQSTTTTTTTTLSPSLPPLLPIPSSFISESPLPLKASNCFTRRARSVLKGYEELTFSMFSVDECLQRCIDETAFFCASVNFELTRKLCVLNGGSSSLMASSLEVAQADYYENNCLPKGLSKATTFIGDSRPDCFTSREGTVLLDLNAHLVQTSSLDSCLAGCTRRRFPPCAAVNWLSLSKTCMIFPSGYSLNIASHSSASFHENKCTHSPGDISTRRSIDYDYH